MLAAEDFKIEKQNAQSIGENVISWVVYILDDSMGRKSNLTDKEKNLNYRYLSQIDRCIEMKLIQINSIQLYLYMI